MYLLPLVVPLTLVVPLVVPLKYIFSPLFTIHIVLVPLIQELVNDFFGCRGTPGNGMSRFIAIDTLLVRTLGNNVSLFATMIAFHTEKDGAGNRTVFIRSFSNKMRIVFGFRSSVLLANGAEGSGSPLVRPLVVPLTRSSLVIGSSWVIGPS